MPKKDYDCVIERGHNKINDKLIDFLKTKIRGKYLDVGANTGWLLREVPKGMGIDASPVMVEKSDGLVKLGYAESLPFESKSFNMVVLSCVLEQCENPDKVLEEARRVGRRVIGINPIPGSPWGKIGGWVKSIISPEKFTYTEEIDKDRYYFEL